MTNRLFYRFLLIFALFCGILLVGLAGKRERKKQVHVSEHQLASIPAYSDSIVLPVNIAPLGFTHADPNWQIAEVCFSGFVFGDSMSDLIFDNVHMVDSIRFAPWPTTFSNEHIEQWHELLRKSRDGFIKVSVTAHPKQKPDSLVSFSPWVWFVSGDSIDPYIIYRTSIFEDASYNHIVIEQKNLENFETKPLLDNFMMNRNCMNCHACEGNNINNFLVHLRGTLTGTLLAKDGKLTKLKIPDAYPGLRLVYPSWHTGGDFIAFSTNQVYSKHFSTPRRKGLVTVDTMGDIVILDTKTLELFSCEDLISDEYDDVFPCFSVDGRSLFFCRTPVRGSSAESLALERTRKQVTTTSNDSLFFRDMKLLPSYLRRPNDQIEQNNALRADLMQIDFNPETREFSNLRTVARFSNMNLSATMPFASPDGKYIIVSALPTTTFSVQVMGDLYKICLNDSTASGLIPADVECGYRIEPINALNTDGSETFHTFSHNGRWMVFASNRETFGVPEIYISHVLDGTFSKPFILPQQSTNFYERNLRAFLFPFLSTERAQFDVNETAKVAHGEGVTIKVCGLDKYKKASRPASESGH
ncbi:MAG: hypothetical protein NC048_02140 [Bacteroides sp.]|nr:hypothetical protein [Ruminococcus flavefaciens]MCM1554280.1 hypothetical protein [Bacteroides sp.]